MKIKLIWNKYLKQEDSVSWKQQLFNYVTKSSKIIFHNVLASKSRVYSPLSFDNRVVNITQSTAKHEANTKIRRYY